MYRFKQIKAKYSFVSEVIKPSGECSVFSKIEQIEAMPNLVEGLNFILRGSEDEYINGDELTGFDAIMQRLGGSLYPIELQVLKAGKLKRVKNLSEINKRWNNETKDILTTHKNAYWVERYINMTSKNIRSEESFLSSLSRNSFIQLFFMGKNVVEQNINMTAFPFADSVFNLYFHLQTSFERECHYKAIIGKVDDRICSGHGDLKIAYTEKGQPVSILFQCMVEVVGEGYYKKRIKIASIENK